MTTETRPSAAQASPDKITQLGMGFWGSQTLLSAVEMGLFTFLAQKPADLEALKKQFGLHPRAAQDFFDALVALGMLERRAGVYSNTAETAGGFDYTGADCQGWLREAGFRETRVEHLIGPHSMVVGIK